MQFAKSHRAMHFTDTGVNVTGEFPRLEISIV